MLDPTAKQGIDIASKRLAVGENVPALGTTRQNDARTAELFAVDNRVAN
jgi:hypothetical protein